MTADSWGWSHRPRPGFVEQPGPLPTPCHLWTGHIGRGGYGRRTPTEGAPSRTHYVHRQEWEKVHGAIPAGLEVDHLCNDPRCAAIDHLEAVTPRLNKLRSRGLAALNVAKTHCPRQHPYDSANTKVDYRGRRRCRTCLNASRRRRRALANQKGSR